MSDFIVPVKEIKDDVVDLPNSDRLSLIKIDGYLCISSKLDDGSYRYKKGDKVVYIPESAVVPVWLLKKLDLWNEEAEKGVLSGAAGNIVKAKKLRGTFSQGLLLGLKNNNLLELEDGSSVKVSVDTDVAKHLGMEKFEAPIPKTMSGDQCNMQKYTMRFDFENYQSRPHIFDAGEEVYASEKIHGTCFCVGYVPGLEHKELLNGNIYASSKGVNGKGLVFKNHKVITPKWIKHVPFSALRNYVSNKLQNIVPCNEGNLYQNMLRGMIAKGFAEWLESVAETHNGKTVHVFGEIFGKGIQDLDYGSEKPTVRIFSVAVNNQFLPYADLKKVLDNQTFAEMVPVLYVGPFDVDVLMKHRDGKTTLGGKNIREGIVVTSTTEATHHRYGRKVAKFVSEAYLLRKNPDATEHQ